MVWVSNWIQGIVVAVIIGTIIEMILPEGNCKKYIKVVIGVYILFSIISPVITKFSGNNFSVTNIFDLNEYIQASSNVEDLNENQQQQIRNIYETNLKNDIKEKLKSKGYEATKISLNIENNNQYTLKNINITLKKAEETKKPENTIKTVNEVEIQIGSNTNSKNNEQKENSNSQSNSTNLSNKEKNELKQYLSGIYEIDEKNISIN